MFTGIVEEAGRVESAARRGELLVVRIAAPRVGAGLAEGASIAVNGCCLTAVSCDAAGFVCELTPETLARIHAVALTPDLGHNNQQILADFIQQNEPDIIAEQHDIPLQFQGTCFKAVSDVEKLRAETLRFRRHDPGPSGAPAGAESRGREPTGSETVASPGLPHEQRSQRTEVQVEVLRGEVEPLLELFDKRRVLRLRVHERDRLSHAGESSSGEVAFWFVRRPRNPRRRGPCGA